jgi:signal transduction histidine kinase
MVEKSPMIEQTALERRVANLEKMIQVSRALRSSFDLQSLLQEIIRAVVELARCERSSIMLVDPDSKELRFVAVSGADFDQVRHLAIPRQGSIAGTILQAREPIIVHNTHQDPRFFSSVDQVTGQSTDSILGVPLEIGGRTIGVLQAVNKQAGQEFDREDVETLLMFAPQAAAAIENTRLIEEQRQRLTETLLLQEVLLTLSRFMHIDQLLEQLLELLEEWLGYTHSAVLSYNPEHDTLHTVTSRGFKSADLPKFLAVDETTTSGMAAAHKELVRFNHVRNRDLSPLSAGTRSALSVPMLCGLGVDLVGVISVESADPDAFAERDVRLLTTIATQAAIGIRQAELYEDSRRANRLKQEFITTMSHELRTPMTVLIGYSDMLLNHTLGPLNQGQAKALHVVRDRADLLLRLLNDILDYSKIVSGEFKLYPAAVNLSKAIQATVEKYGIYAERKSQTISVHVDPGSEYILADEQRLRQVLGHLVHNATKFSPEERAIVIRSQQHDKDYVRVDVIDQGIGIKPEDMGLLFEDFRQLDSSFTREYDGAGMGLAICKHLIELQGGMIWVESEFGQGSTFSFILPRSHSSSQSI